MKTTLNNPQRIKLPFKLFEGRAKVHPYHKLGYYLQAVLDTTESIDLSKIWWNQQTESMFDKYLIAYLMKANSYGKKAAKQDLSLQKLFSGPALDLDNQWNLDTGYIYVEADFKKRNY